MGFFQPKGKVFEIDKSSTIKEDEDYENENRLETIKEANSKQTL